MTKIYCPNCGRIIGDTTKSVDCNFNCRGCKKTVPIKIIMANTTDYFKMEENKND